MCAKSLSLITQKPITGVFYRNLMLSWLRFMRTLYMACQGIRYYLYRAEHISFQFAPVSFLLYLSPCKTRTPLTFLYSPDPTHRHKSPISLSLYLSLYLFLLIGVLHCDESLLQASLSRWIHSSSPALGESSSSELACAPTICHSS